MVKRMALGLLALASLGLIGTGLWMLSIPAALIVVGGLVWLDLTLAGRPPSPGSGRKESPS